MIDCTCGFGKDISEDTKLCPVCGTDVAPLHRIKELPRYYYNKGKEAENDGCLDSAIECLSTAVSLDESFGEGIKALGDIYLKMNMHEGALRYYARALQLERGDETLECNKHEAESEIARRAPGSHGPGYWRRKSLVVSMAIAFVFGLAVLPALNLLRSKRQAPVDYGRLITGVKQSLAEESVLKGINVNVVQFRDSLRISGEIPSEVHKSLVSEIAHRVVGTQAPVILDLRVAPQQEVQPILYTVRAGDNLSALARMQYGDRRQWTKIFSANRDKLSSPSDLLVGQVLVIPK